MQSNEQHRGINLFYLVLVIICGLATLFAFVVLLPQKQPRPVSITETPTVIIESGSILPVAQAASSALPVILSTSTPSVPIKKSGNISVTKKTVPATTASRVPASVDRISPTTPGNLVLRSVSYNQAVISWSASTDNRGIEGYNIYQDSALVGTSIKTIKGFMRLSPATKYTFGIASFNAAGNISGINTILVTTTAIPVAKVVTQTPAPLPTPSPVVAVPPTPTPTPTPHALAPY